MWLKLSVIIPNIEIIRNEALLSLTKEFDLEKSQSRYATVNPELIKLCESLGLTDEKKDASRALFVADYVFTESPTGSSEEDRRKDVIKMFLIGLDRTQSSEIIVQAFHLAYKTASMIKRRDIFMAGRGVPRETSLLILKDIFLDAYLQICSELLGVGKCGFELALLAGALKKTFPTTEYEAFKDAPKASEHGAVFKYTWKLLNEYNAKVKVEVNDQVVIPNIDTTNSLVCVNSENFSSWNIPTIPPDLNDNKKMLRELNDFISQADHIRPLVYFRGKILKTNEKVFLIRNPHNSAKPFLLFRSTADEVNVTEMLTLLNNRGRELSDNMDLFKPGSKVIQVKEKEEVKQEKPIVQESSKPVEVTTEASTSQQQEPPKKLGFFARLFGRGKKKEKSTKQKESGKKTAEVPKAVQKPSKKETTKTIHPPNNLSDFISNAVAVIGVGDLQLFEIFDTYRESNYQFLGVLHSDFTTNSSTFKVHKEVTDARELVKTLDGLDVVLEKSLKHFFGPAIQIMPEEILFTGTADDRYVMLFEGNDEHLVSMAGSTSITEDYTGKEPEILQRRTLGMRTNQILNSLKSNRFEDAVQRILGEELLSNTKEITYDSAVLDIHK